MASPNGVRSFYRFSGHAKPQTIILAGCGRGEEIPTMRKLWPRARIIGIEPLIEHWRHMAKFDCEPDVRIKAALWHTENATLTFRLNYEPDQRATVYGLPVAIENEITRSVETVSLDGLHARHGPWPHALLWMDIEGAEWEALRTASCLLDDREIQWVNAELNFLPPRQMPPWTNTHRTLEDLGFRLQAMHSVARSGRQADGLYIRHQTWEAMRVAVTIRSKQRKLDRLTAGRGRTQLTYLHPDEDMPRESLRPIRDDRDPGPAAQPAAAGKTAPL